MLYIVILLRSMRFDSPIQQISPKLQGCTFVGVAWRSHISSYCRDPVLIIVTSSLRRSTIGLLKTSIVIAFAEYDQLVSRSLRILWVDEYT